MKNPESQFNENTDQINGLYQAVVNQDLVQEYLVDPYDVIVIADLDSENNIQELDITNDQINGPVVPQQKSDESK